MLTEIAQTAVLVLAVLTGIQILQHTLLFMYKHSPFVHAEEHTRKLYKQAYTAGYRDALQFRQTREYNDA